MYCSKCGWNNPDDATKCANCSADLQQPAQPQPTQMGQTPQPPQPPPPGQPYGQQPQAAPQPYVQVPNYLAWSIVITAVSLLSIKLCCLSLVALGFGIVAIVKSAQSNTKKGLGDFSGAVRDADAAKTWLYWAVGVWAVAAVVGIIALVFFAAYFGKMLEQMQMHNLPR
jgi:hypothetical protein